LDIINQVKQGKIVDFENRRIIKRYSFVFSYGLSSTNGLIGTQIFEKLMNVYHVKEDILRATK